jgi:hypothetical protein
VPVSGLATGWLNGEGEVPDLDHRLSDRILF